MRNIYKNLSETKYLIIIIFLIETGQNQREHDKNLEFLVDKISIWLIGGETIEQFYKKIKIKDLKRMRFWESHILFN